MQLNVNNVFDHDAFVPLREAADGQLLFYRFNPPREYVFVNRFAF